MADLRRLCRDQAICPDQLWGWPIERLGQALAWPAHCLVTLSVTGLSTGLLRSLTCLLVPFCRVILIGLVAWMMCTPPPSGHYFEGDRSLLRHINARTAIAVVGTRSASDHGLVMAEALGRVLAAAGWPVLSGLAEK